METENSSEVDDTDKGSGVISQDLLYDKNIKLKSCFGNIEESEDYVSDLNAEVDLDENIPVLVAVDDDDKHDKIEVSPSNEVIDIKVVTDDDDGGGGDDDDDKTKIKYDENKSSDTEVENVNNEILNKVETESGTPELDESKTLTENAINENNEMDKDASDNCAECKDVENTEDMVNEVDNANGTNTDIIGSDDPNDKHDLVNSVDSLNAEELCQATKECQNDESENNEEQNCEENNQNEIDESISTDNKPNTNEHNESAGKTEIVDEIPNISEPSESDANSIKNPDMESNDENVSENADGKTNQSANTQSDNIEIVEKSKLESDSVEKENDTSDVKMKHDKIDEASDTNFKSENIEKNYSKETDSVKTETDEKVDEMIGKPKEINVTDSVQNDVNLDTNEVDKKDIIDMDDKTKDTNVETISIKSDNDLQIEENDYQQVKESFNKNIEDNQNIDQNNDSTKSSSYETNSENSPNEVSTNVGTSNDIDDSISCDVIASNKSLTDDDLINIDEDYQSKLDREGIQQFLKAVIDDLQGIVIETEECDNVINEISSKDEESKKELNLPCVEIDVKSSTLTESIETKNENELTSFGEYIEENDTILAEKIDKNNENLGEDYEPNNDNVSVSNESDVGNVDKSIVHNDTKLGSEKEDEKLDRLELIIDHTDSDDADIVNDVKECELMIEERTDETIQCVSGSDNENTSMKDLDDTNELDKSDIEVANDITDVLTNESGDKSLVAEDVLLDDTGVNKFVSDDNVPNESSVEDVNSETSDDIRVSEDITMDIKEDNSLVPDSTDKLVLDGRRTDTREPKNAEPKEPSSRMVTKETELSEVRSSLKVSQQLLLDERSKHNREVMSLKLQLCRSQMQLKCQRARSDKQMTDIMAQLVVLESRLLQEQKTLQKELRNKNQTIASQRQEIIKLNNQNEQLLNAIKEICANGGMNGYMRENRRKNGSNMDVEFGGKSGKDKKGHNSGKLGSVKDKFLSKNRSSLELHSFNMEKYLLKDDRLCSSQEDLRKISENRRQSIPNGVTSLNGGDSFDVGAKDRPHSDSSEYKNRKSGRNSQNFFSDAGSPQYGINKSVSESSHLSETSNSSSGVYSLSDHDLSVMHDVSMTNGNHGNHQNDDEEEDHIFSFSSTHINTVIDEEAVMGPISHSGPMMSMGSMPMLANLSDEQCLRTGKHRPHSLSSVDLASIQLQAEHLSSPGIKIARSPLTYEMETPPGSPSSLQNKNELTPFQTFKTMFRRKGSSKNKGHKKRSVSLSQTTNKEYSEALKKHFQKYDMS